MAADCHCGHPFNTGACLSAHAAAKAAMEPVVVDRPHEHRWLPPQQGRRFCAEPACDAIRRHWWGSEWLDDHDRRR